LNNNKLKGGVIGLGKMGLLHSAIINALENSTLVAASEPNKTLLSAFSSFVPNVHFYDNYKMMLESEKLDFIFIATPPLLHIEMGLECIKRGIPFFVEKPLCLRAPEAELLINVLEKKSLTTMVGYMMRYMGTYKYAKDILERKILGQVISVNASMYVAQLFKTGKGWRYSPKESGGGCLITQAIHVLDLLYWYFGVPNTVNARTNSFYSKTVEDFGHVVFSWKNGMMGWLDSSWSIDNHRLLETNIQINAENGTLMVNDDTVKMYLRKDCGDKKSGWHVKTAPELFQGVAVDIGGPYYTIQNETFVNAIKAGKQVENDIKNAYIVQKVMDDIYKSAESDGQTIIVK
jgi:predicted dehydrogenase